MRGMKILTALICLVTVISICSDRVSAAAAWDIENTLDVSECRQGDVITMTVSLKGVNASAAQEIVSMSGTLEYDTSLFTVEKDRAAFCSPRRSCTNLSRRITRMSMSISGTEWPRDAGSPPATCGWSATAT